MYYIYRKRSQNETHWVLVEAKILTAPAAAFNSFRSFLKTRHPSFMLYHILPHLFLFSSPHIKIIWNPDDALRLNGLLHFSRLYFIFHQFFCEIISFIWEDHEEYPASMLIITIRFYYILIYKENTCQFQPFKMKNNVVLTLNYDLEQTWELIRNTYHLFDQ